MYLLVCIVFSMNLCLSLTSIVSLLSPYPIKIFLESLIFFSTLSLMLFVLKAIADPLILLSLSRLLLTTDGFSLPGLECISRNNSNKLNKTHLYFDKQKVFSWRILSSLPPTPYVHLSQTCQIPKIRCCHFNLPC